MSARIEFMCVYCVIANNSIQMLDSTLSTHEHDIIIGIRPIHDHGPVLI